LLVVSCSSSRSTAPQQKSAPVVRATPGLDINRAHKDGAPWWDVDVSRIPDATPTLHTGPYKANPYTVLGKTYFPMQESKTYVASGTASWYGTKFHGQNTANGEVYDLYGMSAAHKTLPLPSYVKVTNLDNGKAVVLRVNDRGPFYSDRIIDLSYAAAKKLGYAETGTARVKVEGIDPQQWWAQRGRPAPLMLNEPKMAQNAPGPPLPRQGRAMDAACAAARHGCHAGAAHGQRAGHVFAGRRLSPTRMPQSCFVPSSVAWSAPPYLSARLCAISRPCTVCAWGRLPRPAKCSKRKTACDWPIWASQAL
jgi:rare lipoprotein A (peptidoglycan hydrolase)